MADIQQKSKSRNMIPLKYSCEEIYERMDNGLCIFCEEQDTPGHNELKHKGIQIVIIEDEQVFDDKEVVHLHEALTNPSPEPLEHTSSLQMLDPVFEVLPNESVHNVDLYVKGLDELPQGLINGNDENLAHQVIDEMPLHAQHHESSSSSVIIPRTPQISLQPPDPPDMVVINTIRDKKSLLKKESCYNQTSHHLEWFTYPKVLVLDLEHIRKNRLQSHDGRNLVEFQIGHGVDILLVVKLVHEKEMVLSIANHVWKPGGLMRVQDQWNRISEINISGGDFHISEWCHGVRLQEITNVSRKFRKVIVNNMLDVLMICGIVISFEKLAKTWKFKFKGQLLGDSFLVFLQVHEARVDSIMILCKSTMFDHYLQCLEKRHRVYVVPIKEVIKKTMFITFTVIQSHGFLVSIVFYGVFHSSRPPKVCESSLWENLLKVKSEYIATVVMFYIGKSLNLRSDSHIMAAKKGQTKISINQGYGSECGLVTELLGKFIDLMDEFNEVFEHHEGIDGFQLLERGNIKRSREGHTHIHLREISGSKYEEVDEILWFYEEPLFRESLLLTRNIGYSREHVQIEDSANGIKSSESCRTEVEVGNFCFYKVFHLQRPPEMMRSRLPRKYHSSNIKIIILEDKDV